MRAPDDTGPGKTPDPPADPAAETERPPEPAAKPAPDLRTPPEWARHFGLEPPEAAGVRAIGRWLLHEAVSMAKYRAAHRRFKGGSSHGGR